MTSQNNYEAFNGEIERVDLEIMGAQANLEKLRDHRNNVLGAWANQVEKSGKRITQLGGKLNEEVFDWAKPTQLHVKFTLEEIKAVNKLTPEQIENSMLNAQFSVESVKMRDYISGEFKEVLVSALNDLRKAE